MSVPEEVTREALAADISHWPDAAKELAEHEAHIAVAASADQKNAICLAVGRSVCHLCCPSWIHRVSGG
jgi:hypothetical protein